MTGTGARGNTVQILAPATGELLETVETTPPEAIPSIVDRARSGLERWAALGASRRSGLLLALADEIDKHVEEIAALESRNTGKAIRETRNEASRMPQSVRYWAGWADKIHGTTVPFSPDFVTYTEREPYGVVAGIIPWNVPFVFAVRRIVPVLATGNVVVLKPAEETPLTAMLLERLCRSVGIPEGVVQVVIGGAAVGAELVEDANIDLVLFTGFHETGKAIARSAAGNLTPTIQELGGKSPHIVFPDADLDAALEAVLVAVFSSTGQMCFAGSRLLVHSSIADDFVAKIAERVRGFVLGDPEDEETDVGPHVTRKQRDKTLRMIEEAIEGGARVAAQAELPGGRLKDGFFAPPTVFVDVDPGMAIARNEVFGPVLTVFTFETDEEAVTIANDTDFGLAAGVWTSDLTRAHAVSRRIHAGRIWVNTYRIVNDMVPGGGYGQSGYGAEGGTETIASLTRSKSVQIALQPGLLPGQPRMR